MKSKKKMKITLNDYIKAVKSADREMEKEIYGNGFKSKNKVHKSAKNYTRKVKHKKSEDNSSLSFLYFILKPLARYFDFLLECKLVLSSF